MGVWDKIIGVGGKIKQIATGTGRVMAGDWTGFSSVYSGVRGLFKDEIRNKAGEVTGYEYKDAFSDIRISPYRKPNVSLMQYKEGIGGAGSAGRIAALGDVENIPKWSKNQAVAMYYLNMINKITTQGSPRKGA